jgi:hypothetical protein
VTNHRNPSYRSAQIDELHRDHSIQSAFWDLARSKFLSVMIVSILEFAIDSMEILNPRRHSRKSLENWPSS